jgi:outer membrane protein assembly factor BamD
VAEAYFRRRNSADRDQTDTREAVAEYQRLLDFYPTSPYAEKARAQITEARQNLARAEFLAGYFYQRTRELCRASIARYEVVLKDYPDYRALDEVLFRLAECLQASGRAPEALPHLGRLLEEYPKSSWAEPARQLMAVLAAIPASPSPAPKVPSPAPPKPGASPSPAA